ncbi:Uncharacterised protein [Vibrio cholerae]|nr:Uncharacterised protein [Vibrio cholerae]CSI71303.1 Uncharacterised protein [Vibrio cholerae]
MRQAAQHVRLPDRHPVSLAGWRYPNNRNRHGSGLDSKSRLHLSFPLGLRHTG